VGEHRQGSAAHSHLANLLNLGIARATSIYVAPPSCPKYHTSPSSGLGRGGAPKLRWKIPLDIFLGHPRPSGPPKCMFPHFLGHPEQASLAIFRREFGVWEPRTYKRKLCNQGSSLINIAPQSVFGRLLRPAARACGPPKTAQTQRGTIYSTGE